MQYTFTAHAERRLAGRNIDGQRVRDLFHTVCGMKVHGGRVQKDLDIDGIEIRVIAERVRKGWHIVTIHFLGDAHTEW